MLSDVTARITGIQYASKGDLCQPALLHECKYHTCWRDANISSIATYLGGDFVCRVLHF